MKTAQFLIDSFTVLGYSQPNIVMISLIVAGPGSTFPCVERNL